MFENSLFVNLVIVLGSATFVATAFHMLHLPPMVGFLFAGMLIGPNGTGLVHSVGEVELLAEIGSVMLLFSLGLEFRWATVFSLRKLLVNLGLAQVVLTGAFTAVVIHEVWDVQWPQAIFSGLLVAMSSTAAVLKLLHEKRHMETPFGRSALGILVSQDLAVIFLLILLPLMSESSVEGLNFMTFRDVGTLVAKGLLIFLVLSIGTRYLVPRLLDLVGQTRSRELFFFSVLFVCCSIALLMQKLGLSLSIGAFCAGVMVCESPYGRQTMSDFAPLRDNFLSLFFVAIGMLLNIEFLRTHLILVMGALLGVIIVKALVITAIMWLLGNAIAKGLATGLILAQLGEFSFILIDRGLHLGLIDESGRQLFLAVAIGSLALTPLLYRFALQVAFRYRYDELLPKNVQQMALRARSRLMSPNIQVNVEDIQTPSHAIEGFQDHVVLIGFGPAAQSLAQTMRELNLPYCILESNPQTVKSFQATEPIFLGDATHREILEQMKVAKCKMVVITATGAEITSAILRTLRQIHAEIPVMIRTPYLHDLKKIEEDAFTHIIVAEFEGAIALLTAALQAYGVGEPEISQIASGVRQSRSAAVQAQD